LFDCSLSLRAHRVVHTLSVRLESSDFSIQSGTLTGRDGLDQIRSGQRMEQADQTARHAACITHDPNKPKPRSRKRRSKRLPGLGPLLRRFCMLRLQISPWPPRRSLRSRRVRRCCLAVAVAGYGPVAAPAQTCDRGAVLLPECQCASASASAVSHCPPLSPPTHPARALGIGFSLTGRTDWMPSCQKARCRIA